MFKHSIKDIRNIDELSRGIYFRFYMILDNFQEFLKNIKAIFYILTNDTPLLSKLMILFLNLIILSEDPLT